jgi:hypothetical protein
MPLPFYPKTSRHSQTLISAFLGTAILNYPSLSFASCVELLGIEQLQGRSYVSLPQEICPQYTDVLLGRSVHQQEYSGVVCDRPAESYILLQKLLKYTQQGKAVWQVVRIKKVSRPRPQSFIMEVGCKLKSQKPSQSGDPIFALVEPRQTESYSTLAAWQIDLESVTFLDLNPQQVACNDPPI